MTAMSHIVRDLMQNPNPSKSSRIGRERYEQWARGFVFDGLRNQRYGQSFCNHFKIQDNILFYAGTVEEADRYIQEHYVK